METFSVMRGSPYLLCISFIEVSLFITPLLCIFVPQVDFIRDFAHHYPVLLSLCYIKK